MGRAWINKVEVVDHYLRRAFTQLNIYRTGLPYEMLSVTPHGSVILCEGSDNRLMLMFHNITQYLSIDDFYQIKKLADEFDMETYFKLYPTQKKIHLQTEFKDLFFSFTKEEMIELGDLLNMASFRIGLFSSLDSRQN